MAQEKSRLDVAFPFDDAAGVQEGLRGLTKVLEARLQGVEASRADYEQAINLLTGVAITRIDDVLRPALEVVQQAITIGFPSDRLTDSGSAGRAVLQAGTHAALATAIALTIEEVVGLPALGKSIVKANTHVDLATALALTVGDVSGAAPKESPVFTGIPQVPTAAQNVNSTQAASTAYVRQALAALIASSPETLDTLNELAAALGNDPSFATTITTSIGLRLLKADPAFTGTLTGPAMTLTGASKAAGGHHIDTNAFFRILNNSVQVAFDALDYLDYDRVQNLFRVIINNTAVASFSATGLSVPALTIGTIGRCYPPQPFAAAAWPTAIFTWETILCDVTVTARGETMLVLGSARVYNDGAVCDITYLLRFYNRTTGDTVLFNLTRIVTASARQAGTAVISFPCAFSTISGTQYLCRLSALKSENNAGVWAGDVRIEGISL